MKSKLILKNKKPQVLAVKYFDFDNFDMHIEWVAWGLSDGIPVFVTGKNPVQAMKRFKSELVKTYWQKCNKSKHWKAFPPQWHYEKVFGR